MNSEAIFVIAGRKPEAIAWRLLRFARNDTIVVIANEVKQSHS
jgi:hypothetical protein